MKVDYKDWRSTRTYELSEFIDDRLAREPYADHCGQIEGMEGAIHRTQQYIGRLTELLVEKGVVTLDEVNDMLDVVLTRHE